MGERYECPATIEIAGQMYHCQRDQRMRHMLHQRHEYKRTISRAEEAELIIHWTQHVTLDGEDSE